MIQALNLEGGVLEVDGDKIKEHTLQAKQAMVSPRADSRLARWNSDFAGSEGDNMAKPSACLVARGVC